MAGVMAYQNFNRLQQDHQLDLVMRHGILLIECKRFNLALRLFQLYDFYVEIYSNLETNEVITVNAFEDVNNLETFLAEIDISNIVT